MRVGARIVEIPVVNGRTIIVGDVHGCSGELRDLVDQLSPRAQDTLVSVGDFASKGPDVVGALELWRSLGGRSVLGNQDARILAMARGDSSQSPRPGDEPLLKRTDLIEWLASFPLWIDLPSVGCVVVHGGLLPGRTLQQHDPETDREAVMKLRAVRRKEGDRWMYVPKQETRTEDPFWATLWSGEPRVIYGHTPQASGRPRFDPRAIGIDTGCVYGRRLSAVVIEPGDAGVGHGLDEAFDVPVGRWSIASVPARNSWAEAPRSFSNPRDQQSGNHD